RLLERVHHLPAQVVGERVHLLRPVECDCRHLAVGLVDDVAVRCHGLYLPVSCASAYLIPTVCARCARPADRRRRASLIGSCFIIRTRPARDAGRRSGRTALMAGTALDQTEFRNALACFASGVTIVTTIDGSGRPNGFTASAFSSLSLDP